MREKDAVTSAVVADAHVTSQPQLQVDVARPDAGGLHPAMAIADTGAQVCVAGPALMATLGLKPGQLPRPRWPA